MTSASGEEATSQLATAPAEVSGRRHLRVVPPVGPDAHEHTWALRETDHGDFGLTINRFECYCGGVSYV